MLFARQIATVREHHDAVGIAVHDLEPVEAVHDIGAQNEDRRRRQEETRSAREVALGARQTETLERQSRSVVSNV